MEGDTNTRCVRTGLVRETLEEGKGQDPPPGCVSSDPHRPPPQVAGLNPSQDNDHISFATSLTCSDDTRMPAYRKELRGGRIPAWSEGGTVRPAKVGRHQGHREERLDRSQRPMAHVCLLLASLTLQEWSKRTSGCLLCWPSLADLTVLDSLQARIAL